MKKKFGDKWGKEWGGGVKAINSALKVEVHTTDFLNIYEYHALNK